jgi:hypothetical protein
MWWQKVQFNLFSWALPSETRKQFKAAVASQSVSCVLIWQLFTQAAVSPQKDQTVVN